MQYTKKEIFDWYQNRQINLQQALELGNFPSRNNFFAEYYNSGYTMPMPGAEEYVEQMKSFELAYLSGKDSSTN